VPFWRLAERAAEGEGLAGLPAADEEAAAVWRRVCAPARIHRPSAPAMASSQNVAEEGV